MTEMKRNSYDNLVMDIMHISKNEYEILTQRNSDLEIYTDYLIEENKKLLEENKKLKTQNNRLKIVLDKLQEDYGKLLEKTKV